MAQPNPGGGPDQISVFPNSSLTVQSGAFLSAANLSVGGNGTITIQGAGTQIQSSFNISSSGTSVLKILDGAVVHGDFTVLAGGSGAGTVATVDGATTQWLTTAETEVGVSGKATLNIQNGAKFTDTNIYFGYETGGNGLGNVMGTGSSLTATGYLRVADWTSTAGTLTISQGGTVSSVSGASAANFSGVGSTDTSNGVHPRDRRELELDQHGAASTSEKTAPTASALSPWPIPGTVNITGAVSINATSTLNIGNGGLAGIFSAASVANTGLIHFQLHRHRYLLDADLRRGRFDEGRRRHSHHDRAHTYTGATTVNAGLFQVDGTLGNTAVTIASGAKLGGHGDHRGGVTIQNGGIPGPGRQPRHAHRRKPDAEQQFGGEL